MIRFTCPSCRAKLSVADSKADSDTTCPHCEEEIRVPAHDQDDEERPAGTKRRKRPADPDEEMADAPAPDPDDEEVIAFSRSRLRVAFFWLLCLQALMLFIGVACVYVCWAWPRAEAVSLKMVGGLLMGGLVAVFGIGYFMSGTCSWKLYFSSTIPSSAHYLLKGDRLERYSRAGELVEEIPYANIAEVRLVTKRSEENPDVKFHVLGITLHNPDADGTLLDDAFFRWSRQMHKHDVALVEDFFSTPIKAVRKKIRKRWERWQAANPGAAEPADRSRRSRVPATLSQKTWVWVAFVVGLAGLIALSFATGKPGAGQNGGQPGGPVGGPGGGGGPPPGAGPGPAPGVGQPPNNPPPSTSGPKSLPGLISYWPLDEGQGEETADAAANGSRGRLHGASWAPGVKGTGVRFNGKDDFVELSPAGYQFAQAAPFTIAGWVATEAADGVICSFRSRTSIFPVVELSVRKGQLAGWVRDDTSGQGGARLTGSKVNDGKWHHVALVRAGDGTVEVFLDGTSQGRDKGKSSGGRITANFCVLGCDRVFFLNGKASPGFLAGGLDEFCVYNRPLTAAEIGSLARDQ